MNNVAIPKEEMIEILNGHQGEILETKIVSKTQRCIIYSMVFKRLMFDKVVYQAHYSEGILEDYTAKPFELDGDDIICDEVKQIEICEMKWVPVNH